MAEKKTLEQVRDWHRKQAYACGLSQSRQDEGMHHDMMADALDAHLAQPAQSEAVAEVYEFPRDFHEPTATMLTGIHFTGMPLPVGTKLYTHSAIDNAQADA